MARALISPRGAGVAVAILLLLRLVVAGMLPLSADEAYYWLWSRHLAAGYYDHPPAIAFLIRAGTALFGDTAFGVRLFAVLLSLPASWFIWRAALLLLADERRAALAALLFNLTLMIGIEALAATPDAPSIAAGSAYVWCLARVQEDRDGRLWLAAGLAAGLGLLSKYAALFLGAGTLAWLLADPRARHWLRTPWPYVGGAVAALVFAPNLVWQVQHHWMTFAFQFGRVRQGHLTLRYLGEFLAAQFGLATPGIFLLAGIGLWHATRRGPMLLLAALVWTGLAYFFFHALRDRVQGNWPCFLYPVLAILAAGAFNIESGTARRWLSLAAAPLAALLLALVYTQALWSWLPIRNDPLPRLLGRGFPEIAAVIAKARLAAAIVTTDYETTAWLRFYQPSLKVIEIDEPRRYPDAPAPDAALLRRPLLYVVEKKRVRGDLIGRYFRIAELAALTSTKSTPPETYELFAVGGAKASGFGKMP